MSHVLRRKAFLISSLALAVGAGNAVAGGFEKATLWDAKYSALAGAAVSSVNNSSAIFFNPAGLAFAESNDFALHASPTWTQASGPADGENFMKGERGFSPAGGFTGLFQLNDRFTMGYGVYATGGASASYKDVTVGNVSNIPALDTSVTGDYSTKIQIVEAGLGLAYQINNNWSVGGTYRLTYATADINILSEADVLGANVGAEVGYNDMSGWNNFGVRLGAMYRPDSERWGWGINFRSEVKAEVDGKASYRTGNSVVNDRSGYDRIDATAETALPMQISTGGHYLLNDNWTLYGEITYSEYSNNEEIAFSSKEEDVAVPRINTNWNDQYNYRIAAEYTGIDGWSLRGGYIYTTPVVPEEYAAPTFSTAGNAHTITFGAGTTVMNGRVDLDFGAEYNLVKNKDVKGGGNLTDDKPVPGTPIVIPGTKSAPGKYESNAYAFHVTARYKF
ncbi:OmpP1/FadL family transporter [Endozoicomonas lisbonensis]|uniref:OmpP1/FadL family transporter n=1 Tax=Endozoicomonas lisbonensis TaxID=3120522 RepID=UPI00339ABB66